MPLRRHLDRQLVPIAIGCHPLPHMEALEATLAKIEPLSGEAECAAQARLDALTKPLGSLGRLEELVIRYAAIRGDGTARMGPGTVLVFVADHGIADAGVSAYPKTVTVEMLRNIGNGGAAISVLARRFGYQLVITDIGVETDTSTIPFAGVRYRRMAAGTRNFLEGPAMTLDETRRALAVGIDQACEAAANGVTMMGIGEMGIGNSTAAAALSSAMTAIAPARIVGRGTGLDDVGVIRKIEVVERALHRHRDHLGDGLNALAAVGGLEIAAMTGACLGGAASRVAVIVDGFIATAAAAVATRMSPRVREYLIFAHRSAEGGHAAVLEALGVRPLLSLDMRLGEGTGSVLAMNLLESALTLFHEMATFAAAGVSSKLQ